MNEGEAKFYYRRKKSGAKDVIREIIDLNN